MTAPIFPSGIYWQAVVLAAFTLEVEPSLRFKGSPDAAFNLSVTPALSMRPPMGVALILAPLFSMKGGTHVETSFQISVTPQISWIPSTAFDLTVTPSISMTAKPVVRGRQINVAVTRASTR